MAGDWIKMRGDLHTHPKVVRMMSALNADKLRIVGGLHAVWCLFDVHSVDGIMDGYTPEFIDTYLGWEGFAQAMIGISWLYYENETLIMPNFQKHNGQSAKRRAQETERKASARRAQTVRKVSADDADKKRIREEKRREDISTTNVVDKRSKKSPDDFVPNEWHRDFAANNNLDLAYQLEKCIDHFKSKGETNKNWDATFRNWLRNAVEYRKASPPAKQNYFDHLQNVSDQLTGRATNAGITIDVDKRLIR